MFEDTNRNLSADQAYSHDKIERVIDKENDLRRKRRHKPGLLRTNTRLKSIRKLIWGRYDGPCLPDDAEVYLDATLQLLMWKSQKTNRHDDATCPMTWAQGWAPSLLDHGESWFEAKKREIGRPRWLSDDEIGQLLAVKAWEIKAYDLRLIGAVDKTTAQRKLEAKHAKRDRDRERMRQKRATYSTSTPRSQSLSATKPWKEHGICRRTWERRRASGQL